LLEKVNQKATWRSVLLRATGAAIVGCLVFFLAFKVQYIVAWKVALPIWLLLCAAVGAICEWQVPDESEQDEDEKEA
jgi:hypothetical protein